MNIPHWRCHIEHDLFGDRLRLFVIRDPLRGGMMELMRPPEFLPVPEGSMFRDMPASFTEWHRDDGNNFVGALIKEAQRAGVAKSLAPELGAEAQALRDHLDDMRRLVFKGKLPPR